MLIPKSENRFCTSRTIFEIRRNFYLIIFCILRNPYILVFGLLHCKPVANKKRFIIIYMSNILQHHAISKICGYFLKEKPLFPFVIPLPLEKPLPFPLLDARIFNMFGFYFTFEIQNIIM